MKKLVRIKTVYTDKGEGEGDIYVTENGVYVRDVYIDAGIGEEIVIGELSDIHFNYCNAQDLSEAEPVVMSTLENRVWCANGSTVENYHNCMELLGDADQIVINGDTLDYLSHGAMELMQREIWDKLPDVIATAGGHEVLRKMQGLVEDTLSREQRLKILENFWRHDLYYVSKLLKNKLLIIGLFDDRACINEYEKERLEKDLSLAREKGLAVLIFAHEPFAARLEKYRDFTENDAMLIGDPAAFPRDMCDGAFHGNKLVGGELCDAVTLEAYKLITENADIVKGIFAAHLHNEMFLNIKAKTPNGEDAFIPQFVKSATAYGKGMLMRICVR